MVRPVRHGRNQLVAEALSQRFLNRGQVSQISRLKQIAQAVYKRIRNNL